jgi:hypothetical protein
MQSAAGLPSESVPYISIQYMACLASPVLPAKHTGSNGAMASASSRASNVASDLRPKGHVLLFVGPLLPFASRDLCQQHGINVEACAFCKTWFIARTGGGLVGFYAHP